MTTKRTSGAIEGLPTTPPWDEYDVIVLGIVLMLLGFLLGVPILWTLGIIVLVIGAVLFVLGSIGRPLGPRRHYW